MKWANSGTNDRDLLRTQKKGEDFTHTDPWRVLRIRSAYGGTWRIT